MRLRPWLVAIASSLPLSCEQGDGSRVPPFFADRPSRLLVGQVLSGEGRPIVSARVTIDGFETVATDGLGRFEFGDPPSGARMLRIDARGAAAQTSDRFGQFRRFMILPSRFGREDFDAPFVLPDLSAAASTSVTLGTQGAAVIIDGRRSGAGARLTIPSGRSVTAGSRSSGTQLVEVAFVRGADLPTPLPQASSGTWIPASLVTIVPEDLAIGPQGAELAFANEFALPGSGVARVFRFDPDTSTWSDLGAARLSSGLIVPDATVVDRGGLYVVAANVAATSATGILQDLDKNNLDGVGVSAFGFTTRSDGNGRFTLAGMPAVDAAGAPVSLGLRVHTGVRRAPSSERIITPATAGTTNYGTKQLAIYGAGSVRFFVALRRAVSRLRPVRIGGADTGGAHVLVDDSGFATAPGLSAGWLQAITAWSEGESYFRGEALALFPAGAPGLDLSLLVRQEDLRPYDLLGNMLGLVLDARTGAPIAEALVQGGADAERAPRTESNAAGQVNFAPQRFGTTTAAVETRSIVGATMRSAFSVTNIDNARVEFPLERFELSPVSSLDPHGLLVGSLVGTNFGSVRRVLTQGYLRENNWFSLAMGAATAGSRLPRRVDPDTTGGDRYELGIQVGRASVVALQGITNSSRFIPSSLALLPELRVVAGQELRADLNFGSFDFSRRLAVAGVVPSIDASLAASAVEYRLGAFLPTQNVIDLTPWIGGASVDGDGLRLPAPRDVGVLAGSRMLGALRVEGTSAGATRTQELFLTAVDGSTQSFLPVPNLLEPQPGATVASFMDFPVRWQAMSGVEYFELEISSSGGDALRKWRVLLGGDATEFRFRDLSKDAPDMLGSGITWQLTLRAHRVVRGPLLRRPDRFQRIAGNTFSFRDGEVGIGARSTLRSTFRTP